MTVFSQSKADSAPMTWRRFAQSLRQNHAMEHATIHIVSQRVPGLELAGRSAPAGFYLYGPAPTTLVASAAGEALARLQAGERGLAVHPRCGTNLSIGALMAGGLTLLTIGRRRRSIWKMAPEALLAIMMGLFIAQPVSYMVQQRVTTDADVRNVRIAGVTQRQFAGQIAHFVRLERD